MTFGEILKKERVSWKLSVKELSTLSGVSQTYISKLENGKRNFPSLETIFNLLIGFKTHIEYKMGSESPFYEINNSYLDEILIMFINSSNSTISDRDPNELITQFNEYYDVTIKKKQNENSKIESDIFSNKIKLVKGTTKKEVIEKPYFDLNWLLTQNEYEVFFDRSFLLDNIFLNKKHFTEKDMYYYNVLNDNDLKTIKDLIVVFLLNKYNYIKNKDDFFNIFTNSEDDKTKRDALYKILYETD